MPQKKSSPPKVMTWKKASLVLAVAVIFDSLRFLFEQFWFFGPALAGVYCVDKTSGVIGTVMGSVVCGAGASVVGYFGAPAIIAFGVVMAMAVGFMGFLVLGLMILMTNASIFKVNAAGSLWFIGGFGASIIPFVGTIPTFSIVLWRLYKTQIKKDKEVLKKYKAEQAALQKQEREQRNAELMQGQSAQMAQAEI